MSNPSCYPSEGKLLFYVEFNRGGRANEFTLFKRHFFHTEEELAKLKSENPNDFFWISNEGHPWNIFTATYGPDGSMPDKKFICWMVDAMNEKAKQTT